MPLPSLASQHSRVAHLLQHSGQRLCLQVEVTHGAGVGRSWGGPWGFRGEGVDPEVGGGVNVGQTGRVTWSSRMSCGMASGIWTAIFTTFRGGAMVQPGRGRL